MPARRQHDQDQADHDPVGDRLAGRKRLLLAARPQRAGLAGRLPAPCHPEPAPGRAAGLRAPQGHRPRRGRGLGQRVSPRHLAPAPPGHRLPVRDPAVRRHLPALAQGPGQTMDPVAAEYRPGSPDLLPRRPGAHPARCVPRRVRRHRGQRDQPGRPRALSRGPRRRDGRQEGAPRPHRAGLHVPPRRPPSPVGRGPPRVRGDLSRGLPPARASGSRGPWRATSWPRSRIPPTSTGGTAPPTG